MGEPMNDAPVDESAGNLPSNEPEVESNPWDPSGLVDEDGTIGGKYKSLESLLKVVNDSQEYITKMNAEKQSTEAKAANEAANQEKAMAVQEVEGSLVKEILERGGEITDEDFAAAEEAGISREGLELKAIKAKAYIKEMTDLVGGEEVYKAMMSDMAEGMSDADKAAFTKDLQGANSKYTIQGMHQAWLQKTGQSAPRISGSNKPAAGSVKPYSSQAELQKDIRYLQTAGRNDKAAWAAHEARKRVTSDDVFFGKQ